MNEPFYQSLPADVQEAIDDAAAEALAYQSEVARRMETDALEQMRANDVKISHPDVASFVPAVRPHVWDELATRLPDGEALIAWLVNEVGRVRP